MADMEKSRQHPFRLSLREHRAMFGVEPDILDQIALYLAMDKTIRKDTHNAE